ncbi:unnamed protein product [Camellia sinensis]
MEPINSSKDNADQVLVEENSHGIKVLLNRPNQLNALSFQMEVERICFDVGRIKKLGHKVVYKGIVVDVGFGSFQAISRILELFLACEEDCNVKLIILKGKGRAFSSGGDVSAVVRDITKALRNLSARSLWEDAGNWKFGAKYFWKEYILNYVSILNGIVMGGGAGASIHGRFRVATENSVFAMPETALGLFPDVGASYFLSRLPGFFGEYVSLTGSRLDGAEMLACGLATHFVPSVRLSLLEEALCKVNANDPAVISAIIDEFSQQPHLREKSSYHQERASVNSADNWISSTIKSLKMASPTSLKISLRSIPVGVAKKLEKLMRDFLWEGCDEGFRFHLVKWEVVSLPRNKGGLAIGNVVARNIALLSKWLWRFPLESESLWHSIIKSKYGVQANGRDSVVVNRAWIREGRVQGVGQCLVREYRMVCNVIRGEVSKDFVEGCRAILLDKDKNPKWEPSKLELVSDDMVDHYFSKVDDEDWEDLKLPTRSNLPVHAIAKL